MDAVDEVDDVETVPDSPVLNVRAAASVALPDAIIEAAASRNERRSRIGPVETYGIDVVVQLVAIEILSW